MMNIIVDNCEQCEQQNINQNMFNPVRNNIATSCSFFAVYFSKSVVPNPSQRVKVNLSRIYCVEHTSIITHTG